MDRRLRLKILKKIAQNTPAPSTDPTVKSVAGSPPDFNVITLYPTLTRGLNATNAGIINKLCHSLNDALYYSSDGKIHLPWMKSVNFNYDTSGATSTNLKNLMLFARLLYQNLITDQGNNFKEPLTPEQIKERVDRLTQSQPLNNLSSTNLGSQMGTKVGGDLKTVIRNYLLQIK